MQLRQKDCRRAPASRFVRHRGGARFVVLTALLLFFAGIAARAREDASATNRPITTVAALRERLDARLALPRFAAAAWGIKVVSLDSGATIFEHNAGKLLKPASNAKLFTGALALDRLGPDTRIKTSFLARSAPDDSGRIAGDLVVIGRGDPSLAARFYDGNYQKPLERLVGALVAAGVKRIAGDLVGDESFFRGPPFGANWAWDDLQYYYGAAASALSLQDNVVDLVFKPGATVGQPCLLVARPENQYLIISNLTSTVAAKGKRDLNLYRPLDGNVVFITGQLPVGDKEWLDAVSVPDPARWFVTQLKAALAARGIQVEGRARVVNWQERERVPLDYSRWTELAAVESAPVGEIVNRMMKTSQNLYAQMLWLQVGARAGTGAAAPESGPETTEAAGQKAMNKFLAEAGIAAGSVLLDEGSGLSRGALVTPEAVVALLKFMDRHPRAGVFREALPVAGQDGSLRNRLKEAPVAGNVRAKTGSLNYVRSLSGYLTTTAGERLAFSLLLNNYSPPKGAPPAMDEVDDLVRLLARLGGK